MKPGAIAPGSNDAAATHNLPQRTFDLTSGPEGPAGFQRQDGIGRRLLGKGRRVRRVIPAWRGQRTATNQMGAALHGRHGAHCRSRWPALSTGKGIFAFGVSRGPGHGQRLRPGLNVADRHELPVEGPCLNVSNRCVRPFGWRRAVAVTGHNESLVNGRNVQPQPKAPETVSSYRQADSAWCGRLDLATTCTGSTALSELGCHESIPALSARGVRGETIEPTASEPACVGARSLPASVEGRTGTMSPISQIGSFEPIPCDCIW